MVLGLLTLAADGAEPVPGAAVERNSAPVQLEAVKVEANYIPKLSFGIGLEVWKDNVTRLATSILIARVRPESEAEQKGLVPRMRILRIDGKPAQEYEASFFKGKELSRIFVDRRNGDKVELEVWFPGEGAARTVVLTEHRHLLMNLPSKLNPLQD